DLLDTSRESGADRDCGANLPHSDTATRGRDQTARARLPSPASRRHSGSVVPSQGHSATSTGQPPRPRSETRGHWNDSPTPHAASRGPGVDTRRRSSRAASRSRGEDRGACVTPFSCGRCDQVPAVRVRDPVYLTSRTTYTDRTSVSPG